MKTQIWANNANYVRKNLVKIIQNSQSNPDEYKKGCEARMAKYDALPRAARTAVGQYGNYMAAYLCKSKRITDKVAAIKEAYQYQLKATAVLLTD